jgi:signal transduction histidine kinase
LLLHHDFDTANRREILDTIHQQTDWLVHIINELLDLARIESRRGKDFMIEAIQLASLVDMVTQALNIDKSRWPLEMVQLDDLPPVRADQAKLRQVLTNVIGNAVKYSPNGGAIEIHGIRRDHADGSLAGITIRDRGIGMTTEQAARVCERFYRVDTSGNIPGTGLGMAIVKEVVELLGGSIDITSAPGLGTTVTILLPTAVAAKPALPRQPAD